jgi:EAL domain-containing protein (putative c-di-GMP-specific phosphodiesterase class I)/ActR/RegA family two-component response regulator
MSMIANRLLIVDDEVAVGDFLVKVAAGRGYEAEAVSNASDFKERLDEWKPARILLDLQMPGTDGIELLRTLAEVKCAAEIVIMSGFDEKVIESARRLGEERGLKISATIRKPFQLDEVENILSIPDEATEQIDVCAIERAIDRSEFCLLFQPKIDLAIAAEGGSATRYKTLGFEGLIRWNHPTRGLLGPGEFLPLAESAGMMDRITDAVIDLALAQQRVWLDDGLQTSLAVNVSAQNLRDAGFADRLQVRCSEARVPPELMIIELTETAAMDDAATAIDIMTRLRIKGLRLAIDDFGTGYSSLVQLQILPFSELKIDRAFVRECDKSRQSRVIVKTMIDLARNLGLTSVAEGVESRAVLDFVRESGCDMAQGYYIAKPLSSQDSILWLRNEHDVARQS